MDDRHFDSLTKAFATGTSRRSLFKGLLGLGGAAVAGATLAENEADAARRPTPTPKPVTCPGQQTWTGTECKCVTPKAPGPVNCGPDCCNPEGVGAAHSECCDNECCYGFCYGEELCCEFPRTFCELTWECCPLDKPYCCESGCCSSPCCETTGGLVCCEGETPKCCSEDICIPAGGCCKDDECDGCESCIGHICVPNVANCPGGEAGCMDCIEATCVPNDGSCDDGNACTQNICTREGTCSNPFYCISNDCCNDGDDCTQDVCDTETGVCSYPFYCTSDACCTGNPNGPACDPNTGGCYNPCQDLLFGSCESTPCCGDMTCFSILESPEVCIFCIPSFVEGVPVPCLGFCDLCCSGKSYLGFCVDCGLLFSSCQDDDNSCCSGFYCQYNPIGDNFCAPDI